MASESSALTTNLARPKTSATLTVRIIKSFEFRTEKSLVLHNINLEATTVGQLKEIARQAVQTQSGWKPYRNVPLGSSFFVHSGKFHPFEQYSGLADTLKLYTKAHGAKTSNLIINLDHDDWILDDENGILAKLGFENETEVSFFNRLLYEQFKLNPQTIWD